VSFVVLYRDSGSVLGTYADREHAVSAAVTVAMERPDLSFVVGLIEVGDDGLRVASFESASDLLASGDPLATTIVDSLATQSQVAVEPSMAEQSLEEDALASGEEVCRRVWPRRCWLESRSSARATRSRTSTS
jgi:hypothetical protein